MGIKRYKDGIEHIDTNILVRLITRDNEQQLKKIKKLLSKKDKLYVSEDVTIMELVYVLQTTLYRYPRELIVLKIKEIMKLSNIHFNKGLIEDALNLYVAHPELSFIDCYLTAITTLSDETPLWTLDHKLATQCPVAHEL